MAKEASQRLETLVKMVDSRVPGAWAAAAQLREPPGEWPVYVRASAVADWLRTRGPELSPEDPDGKLITHLVFALAAWRQGKGIYRFSEELQAELLRTPVTGPLPVDVLRRLPELGTFVVTPGYELLGAPLLGYLAAWDLTDLAEDGAAEEELLATLRILAIREDGAVALVALPIREGLTLDEAFAWAIRRAGQDRLPRAERRRQQEAVEGCKPLISLLLYLCAEDAEVAGPGAWPPAPPAPVKTKRGMRVFPPAQARQWEVGVRLGAALRRQAQAAEAPPEAPGEPTAEGVDTHGGQVRHAPRPHLRRAHWHTYRVGPGRAEVRLRWVSPVLVGAKSADALVATLRPVLPPSTP